MRRLVNRWALAGCLTLALGVMTANAAPTVSPFAGTYVAANWPEPITITDGGRITSSFSGGHYKGTMSGRVKDDGSYSFSTSQGWPDLDDGFSRGRDWYWVRLDYSGTLARDLAGNLILTDDNYTNPFTWVPQ